MCNDWVLILTDLLLMVFYILIDLHLGLFNLSHRSILFSEFQTFSLVFPHNKRQIEKELEKKASNRKPKAGFKSTNKRNHYWGVS